MTASITTTILIIFLYFEGTYSIIDYFSWLKLGLYLLIGLIFSIIRAFLFARKEQYKFLIKEKKWEDEITKISNVEVKGIIPTANEIEKRFLQLRSNRSEFSKYSKKSIKEHVFRWWFLWPVSLIYWLFNDLISEIYNFVWGYLKHFFSWVTKIAENTVKLDDDGKN